MLSVLGLLFTVLTGAPPGPAGPAASGPWARGTEATLDGRPRAIEVVGKAVDPDGTPARGVLVGAVVQGDYPALDSPYTTFTGEDGASRVRPTASQDLKAAIGFVILAWDQEHDLCGSLSLNGPTPEVVEVRLAPSAYAEGRLVGTQGDPIAGAVTRVLLRHPWAHPTNRRRASSQSGMWPGCPIPA